MQIIEALDKLIRAIEWPDLSYSLGLLFFGRHIVLDTFCRFGCEVKNPTDWVND
jgi:hypothetical protein